MMGTVSVSGEKMRQGIEMILRNVLQYVQDVKLLYMQGSFEHATLLAEYAAEELGKASLLFQTLQTESPSVDQRLFRGWEAHELKMKEARRLLGDSVILQSSVFGRAKLPFILGAPEVEASPELRMDCTYVDFREGEWKFGASFVKDHLVAFFTELEKQTSLIGSRL
jgi:AbiV family abortive infection protein